jgi:hypothetical protein
MCAVLDGVAAVKLELVVDGVKALLRVLVTAILDPPEGQKRLWQRAEGI